MAEKGRYLAGQKSTDAQIERILRAYAEGLTAAEFINRSRKTISDPPAPKTVYRIYRLIRRRLRALGTYCDADLWLACIRMDKLEDKPVKAICVNLGLEAKVEAEFVRRRGLTDSNWSEMMGEFIFRSQYALTPAKFFQKIKRMVKVTGRLNEPIRNRTLWRLEDEIMGCQFYMEYSRKFFAGNAKAISSQNDSYERHINYVRWRLRREARRLRKLRAQPGFREDAVPPLPEKAKVVVTREEIEAEIATQDNPQAESVNDGHA